MPLYRYKAQRAAPAALPVCSCLPVSCALFLCSCGGFWPLLLIFGPLCSFRVRYCARFGLLRSLRLFWPLAGEAGRGGPPLFEGGEIWAAFSKIFFEFFYFSVGFFRVECLKIVYFLIVVVVIGCRNAKFGYFWAFLDAFASWMRVYMSLVKKMLKMGLF